MAQLRDPSDSIEGKLIPHIHLISANQYPNVPRLDLQHVTKFLMAAPQIAKDKAPFFWTYLQLPNPGSVILTWQPVAKMGVHFASDGYIWMPEQYHRQDLGNGLSIEIYFSRAGYRPGEPIAMFARRRFRLVPSQQGNPNVPQIDMNLWIIHYAQTEPGDQCESRSIPYTPDTQNMMTERNILQTYGAIERKEFMLSDRGKWPRIPWPGHGGPRGGGPGGGPVGGPGPGPGAPAAAAVAAPGGPYGPMQGRRPVPQQVAYPPAPPPASRSRRPMPQPPQAQVQAPVVPEFVDNEEQDVFDILTPRDLALARYRQNHEWMEEVVSSPYSFHQLEPPELGLGLKGGMAPLTEGIFNAPGADALTTYPENPYVGRLDAGQAEAFRKRSKEYIESEKAEIERLKAEHAKNIASLKSSSYVTQAEKELRLSVEERGPEIWRLEGRTSEGEEGGSAWSQKHNKKVDDIVAQVEAQLGHRIAALNEVSRIQDGGWQEPAPKPVKAPTPVPTQPVQQTVVDDAGSEDLSRRPSQSGSQHSGVMVDDNDIDMGGTAAGLLDQMHTGFSAGSTPLNFPTPGGLNSNAGTPANMSIPSPAPNPPAHPQEEKKDAPQDVAMGNTDTDKASGSVEQGAGGEDWVVVPKGGVSPDGAATGDAAGGASKPAQVAAPKPASTAGTPAVTEGDVNDYSSLGDLDTAGDALAGYGTPGLDGAAGSLGEGLDLNMDMEDSAFGDAFHGVGHSGTPGNQSEGS